MGFNDTHSKTIKYPKSLIPIRYCSISICYQKNFVSIEKDKNRKSSIFCVFVSNFFAICFSHTEYIPIYTSEWIQ